MKIVHISDSHLGARPYGLLERESDIKKSFEKAMKIIEEIKPDIVLHSGDMFDRKNPLPDSIEVALKWIRRLTQEGVYFLAIWGNHDDPREAGRISPAILPENIGDMFKILAPFPGFENFVEINGIFFAGIPHIESKDKLEGYLDKIERATTSERIIVLHQGLRGCIHEGGAEIGTEDIPKCILAALGHVHQARVDETEKGIIAYAGSLDVIVPSDMRQPEGFGFWLLDEDKLSRVRIKPRSHFDATVIDEVVSWHGTEGSGTAEFSEFVEILKSSETPPVVILRADEDILDTRRDIFDKMREASLFVRIKSIPKDAREAPIPDPTLNLFQQLKEYVKDKHNDTLAELSERFLKAYRLGRLKEELEIFFE